MRRNLVLSLVITIAVAVIALGLTLVVGNKPQLGLDLQGGASVVLQPKESVDSGVLDQAIEIIRNRVDALGVAEPEITRQGNSILVELPGVKDQDRALSLVGQTAELRFRPTLQNLPPDASTPAPTASVTPGSTTTVAGATTTVANAAATDAVASAGAASTAAGASSTAAGASTTAASASTTAASGVIPTTPADQDDPTKTVVLEEKDRGNAVVARYQLGPAALTGAGVETAEARVDPSSGQWSVHLTMKSGTVGIDGWNQLATRCFNRDATCPTGQIAIVLDSVVKSSPVVQTPTFTRDQIQITGNFSEREAKNLALVLRYGSLPVPLVPQAVQTVSASLGQDSLRAGIVSGIIGLLLVVLFMLIYYRRLGLVVPCGLLISGALLWSIVSYLGENARPRAHPRRHHRHHRVDRRHRRLVRRVLRAPEGRRAARAHLAGVGRAKLLRRLPHDLGRRQRIAHRRRHPLVLHGRLCAGVRVLPRPVHPARHGGLVLLHEARRDPDESEQGLRWS